MLDHHRSQCTNDEAKHIGTIVLLKIMWKVLMSVGDDFCYSFVKYTDVTGRK